MMKLILIRTAFFLLLCVLCGDLHAQDFKTMHPGVEYARVEHKLGDDPVKIDLLRLDLTKVKLDVHHALDTAIGTEKTSSIAARHGAVAAINSGFFRLDTSIFAGDAVGVLKIDGKLLSEPQNNRTALFIFNEPNVTHVAIGTMEKIELRIRGKKNDWIVIDGINRERKENEIVVYTPEFHRTTLTPHASVEAIVRNGKVVAVVERGSSEIPTDGFVVSAATKNRAFLAKLARMSGLTFGHMLTVERTPVPGDTRAINTVPTEEDVVAGVPRLIKAGKVQITWEAEKASKSFVETRHPRTAAALLKDGKLLLVTVDGRQPGVSVGMNLRELAEYLLSIGATEAMNLDGGGSTTMFLDGKVVNTPSDKEGERKVSDAIVVTLRKNSMR